MASPGPLGSAATRADALEKVTGRAAYAADRRLPGTLYAGILRCPHPHARVRGIDASAADALDGVHAVLHKENTSGHCWYDEDAPLFPDHCRFAGEEVAAVAAETRAGVADALAAIRVDYEPLDFVVDFESALADNAPLVHDGAKRNLAGAPDVYTRGDAAAALEKADIVVERTYTTQCLVHNALEPHGCTAQWIDGDLYLWASTQGIFAVREGIAKKLGLDEERVRVHCDFMGGGFGAKQVDWKQTLIAALLARDSGRPVELVVDRRGENLAVGNRNPTCQWVRLGADKDGHLLAIDVEIDCGVGAYSAGGEASPVGGPYQMLYRCENVRTRQRNVYLNTGPSVAFRAPGYAEGAFGLEQAIDELARRVGLDPLEIRRRNCATDDQKAGKAYSTPGSLPACLDAVRAAGDDDPPSKVTGSALRRGRGYAGCVWMAGTPNPPAQVRLRLYRHGVLELLTGSQDIGTGTRTVLAQVAADAMDHPLERVRCQLGDTAAGLRAPTSSGSCTLATLAPAIRAAAASLKQKLADRPDGAFSEDADTAYVEATGECPDPDDTLAVRTFGAQRADVEVDTETGAITVLSMTVAADAGRIVNPLLAYGQVAGGAIQGLGMALTEERIVDKDLGLVMNANLEDYEIPVAADIPEIWHAGIDRPDPALPDPGIKGLGEPPIIPAAPAIANAVFDAIGVRITDLPLRRDRVLAALAAKERTE